MATARGVRTRLDGKMELSMDQKRHILECDPLTRHVSSERVVCVECGTTIKLTDSAYSVGKWESHCIPRHGRVKYVQHPSHICSAAYTSVRVLIKAFQWQDRRANTEAHIT
jgi:hypothetical protein